MWAALQQVSHQCATNALSPVALAYRHVGDTAGVIRVLQRQVLQKANNHVRRCRIGSDKQLDWPQRVYPHGVKVGCHLHSHDGLVYGVKRAAWRRTREAELGEILDGHVDHLLADDLGGGGIEAGNHQHASYSGRWCVIRIQLPVLVAQREAPSAQRPFRRSGAPAALRSDECCGASCAVPRRAD